MIFYIQVVHILSLAAFPRWTSPGDTLFGWDCDRFRVCLWSTAFGVALHLAPGLSVYLVSLLVSEHAELLKLWPTSGHSEGFRLCV